MKMEPHEIDDLVANFQFEDSHGIEIIGDLWHDAQETVAHGTDKRQAVKYLIEDLREYARDLNKLAKRISGKSG